MITYLGGKTVGGINVAATAALAQLSGLLAFVVSARAELEAQLALTASFHLPDAAAVLAGLAQVEANLTVMLGASVSAAANVSAALSAKAFALAMLAAPAIDLQAQLAAALATGGIHAFAYSGPASAFGTELQPSIDGHLSGPAQGLALVATDPAAWAALATTLRVAA